MPIPRIKIVTNATNQIKIDNFKALVNQELPPESKIYDRPYNWVQMDTGFEIETFLDVRFKDLNDMTNTWTNLKLKIGTLNLIATGSIHKHLCSHKDLTVISCDNSQSQYETISI